MATIVRYLTRFKELIIAIIIISSYVLSPIGLFRLINLVRPSLRWSSKTSFSSWMVLRSLFRVSSVLHVSTP
jgi:uncharacterized membrane protein YkvI